MDKKLRILVASVLPLALLGALKVPQLPVPSGAVEIFNPGNSDFAGFRIVVDRSGTAWSIDGAGRGQAVLQQNVVDALFSDLAAAKPLAGLPTQGCASATDPSTAVMAANAAIVVIASGERSPDLRCSNDPRAAALLADAQTVQRALYVQAYRVRSGITMFGGGSAIGGSQPAPPPPSGGMGTGYP